jgi:hypothetical protein
MQGPPRFRIFEWFMVLVNVSRTPLETLGVPADSGTIHLGIRARQS